MIKELSLRLQSTFGYSVLEQDIAIDHSISFFYSDFRRTREVSGSVALGGTPPFAMSAGGKILTPQFFERVIL